MLRGGVLTRAERYRGGAPRWRAIVSLALVLGALLPLAVAAGAGATTLPPPQVAPGAAGAPFTPITAQVIEPPSPFQASDGRRHLAFEEVLTNISPRPASVTEVAVRASSGGRPVLEQLNQAGVTANMSALGDPTLTRTSSIPSYSAARLIVDAVLPKNLALPRQLQVTLSASFAPPLPGQPSFVSIYPGTATEALPAVPVAPTAPVVVSAPLAGGDWMAANACCELTPHRGGTLGGAGQLVVPERFGIDFIRVNSDGDLYRSGVPESMATNYSYGARLLVVAPATVVAVQKGVPDQPPGVTPSGYSLNQLGGNYVVLHLRPHLYALYAHIAPGSLRVHLGERVRTGQVLGTLGNSGNSTAPHLHFQLMNGPSLLTSQGVAYEFRQLRLLGRPTVAGGVAVQRPPLAFRDAYPLTSSVVAFPGGSSTPLSQNLASSSGGAGAGAAP